MREDTVNVKIDIEAEEEAEAIYEVTELLHRLARDYEISNFGVVVADPNSTQCEDDDE